MAESRAGASANESLRSRYPQLIGKGRLLVELVEPLRGVQGLVAIVLGGSYVSGLAHENSDLDIGLYYREAAPISISDVRSVAEKISSDG